MSEPGIDTLSGSFEFGTGEAAGIVRHAPFTVADRLPLPPCVQRPAAVLVDRLLALDALQRLYEAISGPSGWPFAERALAALQITLDVQGPAPPAHGGLLVVANHPVGALDGLALLALLGPVRPDVRVLGNAYLARIPELRPALIAVDVFGEGPRRASRNAAPMRSALAWLSSGGCLVVFPAGQVAAETTSEGIAVDAAWHPHVAALAARARVPTVPIFLAGAASRVFQTLGRVHPRLRTAWLGRELLRRRGDTIRVVTGEAIAAAELEGLTTANRSACLRARTFALASRLRACVPAASPTPARAPLPLAAPSDTGRLADDVARLSSQRLLVSGSGLDVYCAPAAELPHVLPEIGRLREAAFRAVGEGTGRSVDLDAFDEHYWQLFAWDPSRRAVVGAYRVGATDEIVPRFGVRGLYTRTLFTYDHRLIAGMGPALELGRSFVRLEHQREFAPLLLLWKGIGRVVARSPRYRRVFGAVSISSRYSSLTRHLLVQFLSAVALDPEAARLVRPRHPLPPPCEARRLLGAIPSTLESMCGLVRALEPEVKTIPVLLRQYLSLNARVLGFSVDPHFGDALDALMVADLAAVPPAMLERLIGKLDAAHVRQAWGHGHETAGQPAA